MVDFFEKVPDIVIDKILGNLSFRMAARMSVLSKQWRKAWLSLDTLQFDSDFWDGQTSSDWQKWSRIISNILLNHNGLVNEFYLRVPFDAYANRMIRHSQWISFLSRKGVKKISIINVTPACHLKTDITSYIFSCTEIVYLKLFVFNLYPPPTDFSGFRNLETLVLVSIHFTNPNIFRNLIEKCKMLTMLRLDIWTGMDHVVIDSPSLQTLILTGPFESLAFKNVGSLNSISLRFVTTKLVTVETIDAVNLLARSCQLQYIMSDGYLFKYFAAGGIERSSSVTLNHLEELCLRDLSLRESGVFRDLMSMIECCPYIEKLDISLTIGENVGADIVEFNYNHNHRLDHLCEVVISGITGSIEEFKLVEYLLAISTVLENLFLKSGELGIKSKRKMSRELKRFPRASPKARLLFLEN